MAYHMEKRMENDLETGVYSLRFTLAPKYGLRV